MLDTDCPMDTIIDPVQGIVELPLAMTLGWFDAMRQGVAGIVTLCAATDAPGFWTFAIEEVDAYKKITTEGQAADTEDGDDA